MSSRYPLKFKMRFSAVAAALVPVGVAFAQTTHVIQVGGNGSLTYSPSEYVFVFKAFVPLHDLVLIPTRSGFRVLRTAM